MDESAPADSATESTEVFNRLPDAKVSAYVEPELDPQQDNPAVPR